jgi:chromate transporter
MHVGHERAGVAGLFVAGVSFILPAVLITAVFAWLYQHYGRLPQVEPFIYGIKPAVIAIIVAAVYSLGKKAVKNLQLLLLGLLTLGAALLGVNEIAALLGTGLLGMLIYLSKKPTPDLKSVTPFFLLQALPASAAAIPASKIFFLFLKVGAVLYGSGYVLFAFLDAELVAKGYMERQPLIDAIAVGQFTPGPVLSTATFVGWHLGGWQGAIAATAGIFLPSFFFVLVLNPLIPRMRKSRLLSSFLDAVNVASVAVIVAVILAMGRETLTDWRTVLIAIASLVVVLWLKKANSAFIVMGGALLGYLLTFL